jgi:hypothetical protein
MHTFWAAPLDHSPTSHAVEIPSFTGEAPYAAADGFHDRFMHTRSAVTVASVSGRARHKKPAVVDYPGYCARPACRKEFRRTIGVSGHPRQ